MSAIQNLFFFVIFLGVLVTVHELGHFLVAKWCGVKVLKFSIGFGPRIVGFTKGETEYRIAWIPLGGYVRMAGEQPEDDVPPEDLKRSFQAAPPWKRAAIVIAGPAFNLIFPVIAYFFVYLGDTQVLAPRIRAVVPEYPAARAGLVAGDLITKIDGKPVVAFDDIRDLLGDRFDRQVEVTVDREGREVTVKLQPQKAIESDPVEKVARGFLGIESRPRPPILGVPEGSPAQTAGLRTFDRVLSVDGVPVNDEASLARALGEAAAAGKAEVALRLMRPAKVDLGSAVAETHTLESRTVPLVAGTGLAALGAESAELYVWSVTPGSPAAKAGLAPGAKLLSLAGKPLTSFVMMSHELEARGKESFELGWRQGTDEKAAQVAQAKVVREDALKNEIESTELGAWPRPTYLGGFDALAFGSTPELKTLNLGPWEAFVASVTMVPKMTRKIGLILVGLFTRDIPMGSVGGPIMLFQVAAKSAEQGFDVYVGQMALVSINLGLVNLLPIPVLDGFALLAAAWEAIRRRPIPIRAREYANMVGLAMLAVLMVAVFYSDISKLLR